MAEVVSYDYNPGNGGGNFLNLKSKGDQVTIRLAAKPIVYYVHWLDNKPTICDDQKTCPICKELEGLSPDDMKKKDNAQRRRRQTFIWPVIDRADGQAKIFKGGINIFLSVAEFAKDTKWGGAEMDATKFDITITRTETSLQNFYSVVPDPTSLTKEITKEETQSVAKLASLIDSIATGAASQEVADDSVPDDSNPNPKTEDDFIAGLEADK